MFKAWEKIIDSRCDDIDMNISKDKKYNKLLEESIEIEKALKSKLTPEDKKLLDELESINGFIQDHMARKCYKAGLCDGVSLCNMVYYHRGPRAGEEAV